MQILSEVGAIQRGVGHMWIARQMASHQKAATGATLSPPTYLSAILLDYTFPTSSPFIDSAINECLRQRAHHSSTIEGYNTHLKPKNVGII